VKPERRRHLRGLHDRVTIRAFTSSRFSTHGSAARRQGTGVLCCRPPRQTRRGPSRVHSVTVPSLALSAGDCAAVPYLNGGVSSTTDCSPAHNCGSPRRSSGRQYRRHVLCHAPKIQHKYFGSVASLGLHKGVAYGRHQVSRLAVGFMHRHTTFENSRVSTPTNSGVRHDRLDAGAFLKRKWSRVVELHDPRIRSRALPSRVSEPAKAMRLIVCRWQEFHYVSRSGRVVDADTAA